VDKKEDRVTLRRLLALYGVYARMDLAWLLRDKAYAALSILADAVSNIASVSGVFLLAWRFKGIGGMSEWEVLFMLAYSTLFTGVFVTFCASGNTGHVSRLIGRGQLEHMFMQPLPLYAQLLTAGFIPFTGSSGIFVGAGLMIAALSRMQVALAWWWVFALVGSLFVSLGILLGVIYLFSATAFYAPVQAEEIATDVDEAFSYISTFPLSGMPRGVQTALVTAVPAGLLVWYPSLALLHKTPLGLSPLLPLFVCCALWAVTLYFFRKGLNYYVRKGINRYSAKGHRR